MAALAGAPRAAAAQAARRRRRRGGATRPNAPLPACPLPEEHGLDWPQPGPASGSVPVLSWADHQPGPSPRPRGSPRADDRRWEEHEQTMDAIKEQFRRRGCSSMSPDQGAPKCIVARQRSAVNVAEPASTVYSELFPLSPMRVAPAFLQNTMSSFLRLVVPISVVPLRNDATAFPSLPVCCGRPTRALFIGRPFDTTGPLATSPVGSPSRRWSANAEGGWMAVAPAVRPSTPRATRGVGVRGSGVMSTAGPAGWYRMGSREPAAEPGRS